jgi:hypothetical protein
MLLLTLLLIVLSVGDVPEDMKRDMAMRLKKDGATRATSVGDLHERLHKKLEELRGSYLLGDVNSNSRFLNSNVKYELHIW